MKFSTLLALALFSGSLIAQTNLTVKFNDSGTLNLDINHNQDIGMTHSLSGSFEPMVSNCANNTSDQECEYFVNSGSTYELVVTSTDELGLTNLKTFNITTYDYICEEVTYLRQTTSSSLQYTCGGWQWQENVTRAYNAFMSGSGTYYEWGGSIVCNNAENSTSCTSGSITYEKGSKAPDDFSHYVRSCSNQMAPSCGTPTEETKVLCYKKSEGLNYISDTYQDLGLNSGHSSCTNDKIKSNSGTKKYYAADSSRSGWNLANALYSTSIFQSGTEIHNNSSELIGEYVGDE